MTSADGWFRRGLVGRAGFVLQVHIAPIGPLVEEESAASMDQALTFFAQHCPDEPMTALVCKSWTLDPQLRQYLKPDSNFMRFQQRWHLKWPPERM